MDTSRISTSRISCSLLPHPIAGTTNNDSVCLKTHAPPLEHLSAPPILRELCPVWQVEWTGVEVKKRMNLAY